MNTDNVLTYYSSARKVQSQQYHDALRGKSSALEDGVQSCDAQQRAHAFTLMNYTGDAALIKRTIPKGPGAGNTMLVSKQKI